MSSERRPKPAVTNFRGEFTQLAAVMQQSWSENKEQSLLYTEEFLRSSFAYPGSDFELAPSIYSGDDLVAFIAGFPRGALINGEAVRILLNTFLTVSVTSKGAGYGPVIWGELMDRAKRAGFQGTLGYCVEGDDMNRMIVAISRLLKFKTERIATIPFLSRFLRPVARQAQCQISDENITVFLELTASLRRSGLCRTWTREEALWHCQTREGALAVCAAEGRRGMLTGHLMPVATNPPIQAIIFDDLLWGDLEFSERKTMLQQFLRAAAARGAQTASCPVMGYASTEPLVAEGFRPSRHLVHAYLTLWNGQEPKSVASLYADVV